MIYYGQQQDIDAYMQSPAMNQSTLKLLTRGVALFNANKDEEKAQLYFEEKDHFLMGTLVDDMITRGEEYCQSKYHISLMDKKPSDNVMSIIRLAHDKQINPSHNLEDASIHVLEAINEHNYQPKWKDESRISKVIAEGAELYKELVASGSKVVLSQQQYNLANTIVENIEAQCISRILEKQNTDVIYQYPVYFLYEGVICKGLLDMVVVNHSNKTILPIDIKTLADYTLNFPTSMRKRRYDFQAAFYNEGLEQAKGAISVKIGKDVSSYKIGKFTFLVESTLRPGNPLIYICTDRTLSIGKYGYIAHNDYSTHEGDITSDTPVLGFHQAIELYKFYREAPTGFTTDKKILDSDGALPLDYFNP